MKIQEIIQKLEQGFESEQERGDILTRLVKGHFSDVSMTTIHDFQRNWDGSRPYEEFAKGMDKVMLDCIQIEISDLGDMVRKIMHKTPLTLETEI